MITDQLRGICLDENKRFHISQPSRLRSFECRKSIVENPRPGAALDVIVLRTLIAAVQTRGKAVTSMSQYCNAVLSPSTPSDIGIHLWLDWQPLV
jgi:hypothetical protein